MQIAILDDNVTLAKSIKKFFIQEGHTVEMYHTKKDFLAIELKSFDIFILDIDLPDGNGLEITKYLRHQLDIEAPVLIISAHEGLETKLEGFENGIDDYIVKPFSPLEIEARIKAIMRKAEGLKIAKKNLKFNEILFDRNMRKVFIRGEEVSLSKKEKGIIEFFMLHPDTFISKDQLTEKIWGPIYDPEKINNTIGVTIFNIRKKLGEKFTLNTINSEGYLLESGTKLAKKMSLNSIMHETHHG